MLISNPDRLIEALRTTLLQVEQDSGASPDDPALVALKRIVLQRIADLELSRAAEAAAPRRDSNHMQSAESGKIPLMDPGATDGSD